MNVEKNHIDGFINILQALNEEDVDYILIGGVAMNIHGFARFTGDIDFFVRLLPENIRKLRKTLHRLFDDDAIEEITFDELDNYPVIRYGTPGGIYIDIMARLGEAVTFDYLEFEIVVYNDVKINVATPAT